MYWIMENGKNKNNKDYKSYMADDVADIADLPTNKEIGKVMENDSTANMMCSLGSDCLCLSDSSVWILGSNGWVQV